MKLRDVAASLPFAHLAGLAPRAEAAPEGPPRVPPAAHLRGAATAPAAEEPKVVPEENAEDEEEEERLPDDEEEEEEEEREEDPDEEMKGASPATAARLRERARCHAILTCAGALAAPQLAGEFAFNTAMPRDQAIALLAANAQGLAAAPARPRLADRMAHAPNPSIGDGAGTAGPSTPQDEARALASRVIAAGDKARGKA